ncbi:uncharacterized protein B0I36DRAFT_416054 [Microdochium trichocladiopsis]|uniref:Ankyrin repeat-containing domain protein n=1 Tax=Microdochium trichocladiopsis TaxID=1682393 RepID=A0A9P9BL57_9PEZI|nr:uncharacterized protein B0I36DRAFT_416054 [Microdochium trichocladiopsis]KAH7024582.1 hypothetical protein B0I36DRAFT_416054 [Microdochium trichocladiopsis]
MEQTWIRLEENNAGGSPQLYPSGASHNSRVTTPLVDPDSRRHMQYNMTDTPQPERETHAHSQFPQSPGIPIHGFNHPPPGFSAKTLSLQCQIVKSYLAPIDLSLVLPVKGCRHEEEFLLGEVPEIPSRGDYELVSPLLYGKKTGSRMWTALHLAALLGQALIIDTLLKNGAQADKAAADPRSLPTLPAARN